MSIEDDRVIPEAKSGSEAYSRVLGDIFVIKENASQARAELGAIVATGAFTIGKLQDVTGVPRPAARLGPPH